MSEQTFFFEVTEEHKVSKIYRVQSETEQQAREAVLAQDFDQVVDVVDCDGPRTVTLRHIDDRCHECHYHEALDALPELDVQLDCDRCGRIMRLPPKGTS